MLARSALAAACAASLALAAMVCCPASSLAQSDEWEDAELGIAADEPPPEEEPERQADDGDDEAGADEAAPTAPGVEDGDDADEDEREPISERSLAERFHVSGELALYGGKYEIPSFVVSGMSISPLFALSFDATASIRIGAAWGFALFGHGTVQGPMSELASGGAAFRSGNPMLWTDFRQDADKVRWRLGLGVTAPAAKIGDAADSAALLLALGSRGAWSPWLWTPETFSALGRVEVEGELTDAFLLGGEGAVGLLFFTEDSTGPTGSNEGAELAAQAAVWAEWLARADLGVGTRLQIVRAGHPLTDDKIQIALAPYLRLGLGEQAHFKGSFLLNLDEPYGFGGGNVWGLLLEAGTSL